MFYPSAEHSSYGRALVMCECGGTGVVEVYTFGIGLRETACPDDNCVYWNGE